MTRILNLYRLTLQFLDYYPKFRLEKECLTPRLLSVFIITNIFHLISFLLFLLEIIRKYEIGAYAYASSTPYVVLQRLEEYAEMAAAGIIRVTAMLTVKHTSALFRLSYEAWSHHAGQSRKVPMLLSIVVGFLVAITAGHLYTVMKVTSQQVWKSEGYNGSFIQSNPVMWIPVHVLGSMTSYTAVPTALSFIVVFGLMFTKAYKRQCKAAKHLLLQNERNSRCDSYPDFHSVRDFRIGFNVLSRRSKTFHCVSEVYSFCLIVRCALGCLTIMARLTDYGSVLDVHPMLYEFGFINTFCVLVLAHAGNLMHREVRWLCGMGFYGNVLSDWH